MIKLVRSVLIVVACLLLGILGYMVWGRVNQEPRKSVDAFVPFNPNSETEAVTPDGAMVQGGSKAITADKYALLIGVTTYDSSMITDDRLQYPESDAKAVADLLKQWKKQLSFIIYCLA